ncbi:hypothetical protein MTR_8g067465 [Medicago truncatula]|uniref:Uncharacterized protein n=1 Tax=Medicago truncatula TaxID=3880 RepID=A0A072TRE7_MEDTR|nr:hypothetical protein MTR_8g067465 [Medicago truncatula]
MEQPCGHLTSQCSSSSSKSLIQRHSNLGQDEEAKTTVELVEPIGRGKANKSSSQRSKIRGKDGTVNIEEEQRGRSQTAHFRHSNHHTHPRLWMGKQQASKLCMGVVFATPVIDARLERCAIPQFQIFGVTSRIKHSVAKLPWLKCWTEPFARWTVKNLRN